MKIPMTMLGDWLQAAGLDVDAHMITRVVIDVRADGDVRVDIEERNPCPGKPPNSSLPGLAMVMAAGAREVAGG